MHGIALFAALLGLAACSKTELVQKFTTPEDQAEARKYIDLLRHGQMDEIEHALDPSIAGPATGATLAKMAAFFPGGEPTSVTLVGAHSIHGPQSSTVNLTFEYEVAGKWLLSNVAIKKHDGVKTIVGFNVYPQSAALETQNRFTLRGKSPVQYAVLAMAVVVPLFTLWALVNCIRTKLKGRKWPWIVFILIGIGRLAVNWTTGAWGISPFFVQLLGVSAFAPLYGPWTLGVSLPLGAAVFLLARRNLSRPAADSAQLA
jgi:hypothetical protein